MALTHAETDRIEEQLDELLDHAQDLGLLSEAERDRLTDAIAEAPAPEPAIVAALEEWRPKLEEASRASGAVYRYAVLRFDDRNRYGTHGVPATLLFSGGAQCIVQVKDATLERAKKRNRCANCPVPYPKGQSVCEIARDVRSFHPAQVRQAAARAGQGGRRQHSRQPGRAARRGGRVRE